MDVRLGWTHDRTILHIRNLVRIITGDAAYDSADHCIGIEWKKGGEIDLFGFLDETTLPFSGDISFLVNGKSVARFLAMGRKPNILRPAIYNVSVAIDGEKRLLDTMVLTVFAPEEKTLFSAWRETYADTGWAKSLPQPPRREPARQTASWYAPGTPGAYMHHDAAKDMRSKPVSGGHGHQATYDHAGMLITNGTIAAGTADFVSPESMWNGTQQAHREQDVKPYIWALHLDGNPGRPDNTTGLATSLVPSRLSRPCIYQGEYIEHYMELRPSTPTGIKEQ